MSWGFVVVRGGVSKNKNSSKQIWFFVYFEEGKSSSNWESNPFDCMLLTFFSWKNQLFLVSLVCSSKVEKSILFCCNKDHLLNFFLFILSSIEMVVGSYKSSFYRCPNFYHHSTIWKRRKNYLVLCQFLRGGRFSCIFSKCSGTIILKKNAFFYGKIYTIAR